jgi:hypothetical protein
MHQPAASTSITCRFPDAAQGIAAMREMRGAGFPVDVTGSDDGEVVMTVRTSYDRLDELEAIVEAHGGHRAPR